ncbi:hypothetical protein EYR38_010670 [Pleurotus pulmonarius]|nr:hypothetical protein EYR38_010670 [Pleurotus pulmonarius]
MRRFSHNAFCKGLSRMKSTKLIIDLSAKIRHIWTARFSVGLVIYIGSRYLGLASCIVSLLPISNLTSNLTVCIRVLAIIAAEMTLAVRTWAIWGRNRIILGILIAFTIGALVPAAITVARDISTKSPVTVSETIKRFCPAFVDSGVGNMWAVPYLMTIMYELVTTSLSLIRICRWRRRIPNTHRQHVLQTLYTDGMLYFLFMLGLGAVNAALVIKASAPELRSNVTQLQTSLHSILSSRIVLHLANSGHRVKELHSTGSTVAPGGAQFTSIFTSPSEELTTFAVTNR